MPGLDNCLLYFGPCLLRGCTKERDIHWLT
jgi:hypothetical protein